MNVVFSDVLNTDMWPASETTEGILVIIALAWRKLCAWSFVISSNQPYYPGKARVALPCQENTSD